MEEKAASLAAKIKESVDAEVDLICGTSGSFEVEINGDLIYSKLKTGKLPNEDELLSQVVEKYSLFVF